jgi:D-arabinose 1-dehydrogenase-like Zn-dependent alcohol dehydrogenase
MKCSGIGVTKFMLPFVPGEVVIGTIEGMGEDVGSEVEKVFELGDRVIGVVDSGGCSRFLSAEAVNFVKAPSNLSNSTALALMQDWMTAYRALTAAKNSLSRANLFGMNILITDAMSAPGQALIALASEERANIYCCAEKTHHEYLKSLSSTITCFEPQPEKWLPDLKKKMHVAIDSTCVDGYASSCAALGKNGVLITLPYVRFDEKRLFGLFDVSWIWRQINFAKAKFTNVRVPTSQIIAIDPMEEFKINPDSEDENSAEKRVDFVRDFQYLALLHERGTIKPNICEKISLRALSSVQNQFKHAQFKNGVVGTGGTVVCMPWRRAGNFVLNVFES